MVFDWKYTELNNVNIRNFRICAMEKELVSKEKRLKNTIDEEDDIEDDDKNKFSNDGSFLELFKNKMKEKKDKISSQSSTSNPSPPVQQNIKSIQV